MTRDVASRAIWKVVRQLGYGVEGQDAVYLDLTHLDREFPEGSGHLSEEDRELSRRNFVKLMGASSALGGLALAALAGVVWVMIVQLPMIQSNP